MDRVRQWEIRVATKRKRGDKWEFRVRRNGLLPKPIYLTFTSGQPADFVNVNWIQFRK